MTLVLHAVLIDNIILMPKTNLLMTLCRKIMAHPIIPLYLSQRIGNYPNFNAAGSKLTLLLKPGIKLHVYHLAFIGII